MRQYTVLLIPDQEDGGYTVQVPALRGCFTEGDTMDEALANVQDLIRLYLADKAARGEPIPEERAAPTLAPVKVPA